jgi:hypothetical protein
MPFGQAPINFQSLQMEISEKTHTLLGLLKTYSSKQRENSANPSPFELAEQDWAASHFIACLLMNVKLPPGPTLEAFEGFRDKYCEETGISISTKSLLDRHWVRIWGGEIKIAHQIQQQFYYLQDAGKDLPKSDFWEKYKLDFHFLERFEEAFSGEEYRLCLPKATLSELIETHRTVFSKTPDIEGLMLLGWLTENTENEAMVFFCTTVYDLDFANDVAAIVWNELLGKHKGHSEVELLQYWYKLLSKAGISPFGFLEKLPSPAMEKFVAAVIQFIENEQDLLQPESEILKSRLDYYRNDRGIFNPDAMPDFPLNINGGFNGFDEVRCWDLTLDIFHYQPIRSNLRIYIREILNLEKSSTEEVWRESYLERAERLLKVSTKSPPVLYTFCTLIRDDFPEIIPVFFKSIENLSLGCYLVQFVPIRREVLPENHREQELHKQSTRSLLFQPAFEIVLGKLAMQRDAALAGKVICEVLLMPARWMYHEPGDEKVGFAVAREFYHRYQNAWAIINSAKSRTSIWFLSSPLAFSEFSRGFIEQLRSHAKMPIRNTRKHLNLPLLSLISSLFQLAQSQQKLFPTDSSLKALGQKIRQRFIQKYCADFKASKIEVLNNSSTRFVQGDVSWHFEPDNPDFIVFEPLFDANLNELGKLLDAVRPEDFEQVPGDIYKAENEKEERWSNRDEKVRNEKVKFRTHFRFVLRFYRALANERIKHRMGLPNWESTEVQVRQYMLKWVGFNHNNTEAGLYDIYDVLLDNSSAPFSELPPLILDIVQTVNLFPMEKNRLEFVERMTDGLARLDLLLKIHNAVMDASCKKRVQEVINGVDIETFTSSQYLWYPIEAALIEATNEAAFLMIAEKLLAFVKERNNPKKSIFEYEHSKLLFEIQLILAYRKLDRRKIENAADEFKAGTENQDNEYLQKRLQFFEGIFLMAEDKMEEASSIWRKLSETDSTVDIHYRKFYCEIQAAIGEADEQRHTRRILNAYDEWEIYESGGVKKEDLDRFWDGITYCKAAYSDAMGADAEFDFYVNQFSLHSLFDIEVLSLIFKNYSRRGMNEQAGRLYLEAREHYEKFDAKSLEKLASIEQLINWDTTLVTLKSAFDFLNTTSVEKLLKVIPDVFNKNQTLPEFLLYEFQRVIEELMGKKKSADYFLLADEDNFNDVITLLLRLRLSPLRFEIGDQPREGVTSNGKGIGEIDITIRHGGYKIAAYEAYVFRDKPRTEEHLTKVFDYNPTGQLFFSVVFYRGKDVKFEAKFKTYQAILKETSFHKRHRVIGKFEEVEGFPSLSNLLFGKTTHGNSKAVMYHLFVNLSYGEKVANTAIKPTASRKSKGD